MTLYKDRIMKEIYDTFKGICDIIANSLHTIVECRPYYEYEWASAVFMTDKFGGGYASFHIDLNTGVITYNYPDEKRVYTVTKMIEIVKEKRDYMLKARDLKEVGEFINSQY